MSGLAQMNAVVNKKRVRVVLAGREPESDRPADPSVHQARRTLLLGRRKPHLVHRRDDARLLGPDRRKRGKKHQRSEDNDSEHSPSSRSIELDRVARARDPPSAPPAPSPDSFIGSAVDQPCLTKLVNYPS